jgi:YbgC/YbaW family acyl-CoA thioester hydrolase
MEKKLEFRYYRIVFGYECDAYGHLNNASYLHILEEARSAILMDLGIPVSELLAMNIHIYVSDLELHYKRSIPMESRVTVVSRLRELTRVKATWEQEIRNEKDEQCAAAVIYAVFARNGKPYRIDDELMARLHGPVNRSTD